MSLVNELHARSIRYFMAVYELSGFGDAAKVLCISQPALSNSISKLEFQIGVKLFERGPGGTKPTPYAEALYRRAKLVSAELYMAAKELKELEDAQKGTVSIGFGPSVQEVFSSILLDVLASRPKLSVTVTQAHSESLFNKLRTGDLDIVICTTPKEILDEELNVEQLVKLPTLPIVRSEHPLTKKKYRRSSIVEYPWIIVDVMLEPQSEKILKFFSGKKAETIIMSDSPSFTKLLICKSNFITFMPITMIGGKDFDGKLVALGKKKGMYQTPLVALTRTNSFLPSAAQIFLDEFRRVFADKKSTSK